MKNKKELTTFSNNRENPIKLTIDEETFRYNRFMRTLAKSTQTLYNIPESFIKEFDCKQQCNIYYYLSEINPTECSEYLVNLMKHIYACYTRRN